MSDKIVISSLQAGNPNEWCKLLGLFGFAHSYIATCCGLTLHQVKNILYKSEIRVTDYRKGISNVSARVFRALDVMAREYPHPRTLTVRSVLS